ncbi:putative glutamine-dependent NAD(+) synthetase protein [Neospora caninum Liverpool]|uniref:NAD(+) synthase (glutamine-hydrolyzing) n=2 Tax=Neospora caninum (strain Liverpool) TaxID=572307 RepID=F0VJI1_NEOCL|nr:putative glutamine-dependent NAD(+) synthetase protein [Neospora caninum Liverpool]CBZ53892.1 putative glutamine-dependent NAD(+) synthetase protein [Neospora caninum Liverpool]|eukprot:XP_003883924.1 putative glutamine-dependent NAD(+) synthetase protein [Neospora caninum Liverpool]
MPFGTMTALGATGLGPSQSCVPAPSRRWQYEQDVQETLARVSVCNLNQWALDFEGNFRRVAKSIEVAKAAGSKLRVGSELEMPGYGCEDHFLETDTLTHSWECLAELLASDLTDGILCDIGIPAVHKSLTYNCRVWILNRRILLVRPKTVMADDLNYRESRYFARWNRPAGAPLEEFRVPLCVSKVTGQTTAPFGVAILECLNTSVASESCEELWSPIPPHGSLFLDGGVEIICNGNGSHYEMQKLARRYQLLRQSTSHGGVYMYSNQIGCDGGRLYFDGSAMICVNGEFVGLGKQFSLDEVEVVTSTLDLAEVRSRRAASATRAQQQRPIPYPTVQVPLSLSPAPPPLFSRLPSDFGRGVEASSCPGKREGEERGAADVSGVEATGLPSPLEVQFAWTTASPVVVPKLLSREEEVAWGPACWMWDYLRRSGAGGFFLPLSGGADSSAVATVVAFMCRIVMASVDQGNAAVLAELERILGKRKDRDAGFPADAKELCHQLLHTCYMATTHSSDQTRHLAGQLASQIGSYHLALTIDSITTAFTSVLSSETGLVPRFAAQGGSMTEDLALQNIQARSRMVLAYFMAQLLPLVRGEGQGEDAYRRDMALLPGGSQPAGAEATPASNSMDDGDSGGATRRARPFGAGASAGDPSADGARGGGRDTARAAARRGRGYLLVLGTANVDEGLRGYFTKYDASSADLNPIGSISKIDLKRFLRWAAQPENLGIPALLEVVDMPPTAELRPLDQGKQQTDEEEMGMTYEELGWFGRLRKVSRCGPFSMLKRLLDAWRDRYSPSVINQKVQHFFRQYARNRHKMCTITPALHVESYNPDDNRFDLRPFLYPNFARQFMSMDRLVLSIERAAQEQAFATRAPRTSFPSSFFPRSSPMGTEAAASLSCSTASAGPFYNAEMGFAGTTNK